jgi:hypothetical protein
MGEWWKRVGHLDFDDSGQSGESPVLRRDSRVLREPGKKGQGPGVFATVWGFSLFEALFRLHSEGSFFPRTFPSRFRALTPNSTLCLMSTFE